MDRTIQVGDLAIVHFGPGQEEVKYIVKSISPARITLENISNQRDVTTAIPSGDTWRLLGVNVQHTLIFEEYHEGLTEVLDVQHEILLKLDYNSVMAMCNTSKEFENICKDDAFWRTKVNRDFGAAKYKPPNIKGIEYYKNVMELDGKIPELLEMQSLKNTHNLILSKVFLVEIAARGRLDLLKYALEKGVIPDSYVFCAAVDNGHVDILDWMEQKNNQRLRNGVLTDYFTNNGYWEDARGKKWVSFYATLLFRAATNGHLNVLEWLLNHGIPIIGDSMQGAAHYGYINILEWSRKNGINFTSKCLVAAISGNQDETAKWLHDRNTRVNINDAILLYQAFSVNYNYDIIKLSRKYASDALLSFNGEMIDNVILYAASAGDLDMLVFLKDHGKINYYNDLVGLYEQAAQMHNSNIIHWLLSNFHPAHIYPRVYGSGIYQSAHRLNDNKTLKMLDKLLPLDKDIINKATVNGDEIVLKRAIHYGVYPTSDIIYTRRENGSYINENECITIMDWIVKNSGSLDSSFLEKVIESDYRHAVAWLHARGINYVAVPIIPQFNVPRSTIPTIPKSNVQRPTIIPQPTIPRPTIPRPTIPRPTIPRPTIPRPTIPSPTIPRPTIPRPTIPSPTIPPPNIVIPRPTIPSPTIPPPNIVIPRPTIPQPNIVVPRPTIPQPNIVIPRPTIVVPRTTIPQPSKYKQ